MQLIDQQIRILFEVSGLSVADIAADLGLEPLAVKQSLIAHSTTYRKAARAVAKENGGELPSSALVAMPDGETREIEFISDEEFNQYTDAYKDLALTSENHVIKEKALRFLIDEKLGRNNPENKGLGKDINVLAFNAAVMAAKEGARLRAKTLASSDPMAVEVIDIK